MQRSAFWLLTAIILLLAACGRDRNAQAVSTVTLQALSVTPEVTIGAPADTPVSTLPITTTQESLTTLTIWIPPEFTSQVDMSPAGFDELLLAFTASRPNLATRVEQKSVGGQGGILSYLRTGRTIAPSILPDLIILPMMQLESTAIEGLTYPLDDLIDPALLDDLYPAAAAAARPDDQTLGIPFVLTELPHLVYDSNVITSTVPLIWDDLVNTTDAQFLFPAAGQQGAVLALEFYLAAGGSLTNEAGQPMLQTEALVFALEQLSLGRSSDFVASQSSNISSLDEVWQRFENGSAGMVQTTAGQYLRQRSEALPTGFAPLAGPGGALTPLVDGWAWAISTGEPSSRALAADLLALLVSDPFLGSWSYQSKILPARRQAFSQWPTTDPYIPFLQQELERARPYALSRNGSILQALSDAVFDVISLSQTPQVAAAAAVSSIQP